MYLFKREVFPTLLSPARWTSMYYLHFAEIWAFLLNSLLLVSTILMKFKSFELKAYLSSLHGSSSLSLYSWECFSEIIMLAFIYLGSSHALRALLLTPVTKSVIYFVYKYSASTESLQIVLYGSNFYLVEFLLLLPPLDDKFIMLMLDI